MISCEKKLLFVVPHMENYHFKALMNYDGVVKTLHLVRCYNYSIIATYPMHAEIKRKIAHLQYEAFYLSIEDCGFYEFVNYEEELIWLLLQFRDS